MNKDFTTQLSSDWKEVLNVNEEVHSFLEQEGIDPNVCNTYTMVACELVENAIKYGSGDEDVERPIELTVSLRPEDITVQVRNRVDEESQIHLRRLDRALQWVRGFQDPFQAYVERLKQISREPAEKGKSGLGIVRIAYEAHVAIDFVVGEDDVLTVSAVAGLGQEAGGSNG